MCEERAVRDLFKRADEVYVEQHAVNIINCLWINGLLLFVIKLSGGREIIDIDRAKCLSIQTTTIRVRLKKS